MNLRRAINERPWVWLLLTVVMFVVCGYVVFSTVAPAKGPPNQAYFTIDDGKTYFADAITKVPPFEKDGKEAVGARVYTCGGGKLTYVACLEKYPPDAKKELEAVLSAPQDPAKARPGGGSMASAQRLVKKPGEAQWVSAASTEGGRAAAAFCPDGKSDDIAELHP